MTVPACSQRLAQPGGCSHSPAPSFGPAPRRWVLQGLQKYLCAGPWGPGLWGPRAPGAPVPLGLAARRRRRQEQLLQLQREGARKGVGTAARAGEKAPWLTCEHIHPRASDPKMGQNKYQAGRVGVSSSQILGAVGQVPGCVQPCGGRGCPRSIQPTDPQAGWGSEDRREFTSHGHTGAAVASQLLTPSLLP